MKKLCAAFGTLMLLAAPLFADEAAPAAGNAVAPAPAAAEAPAATAPAPMAKKASKAGMAGDEEGVKKSFEGVSTAWNAGDIKGLMAFFTLDSSFSNPGGKMGQGRKEVAEIIGADLSGPLKGTQMAFDDFNVRFYPQPNIALVDCTVTLTGMKKPDGMDADPSKSHCFGIIVNRTGKKWQALLIRAYAFMPPPGAAPAADASAAPAPAADSTAKPADKAAK